MSDVRRVEEELRRLGLTDRQVEAGMKYYLRFCVPLGISVHKSVRMIRRIVENMRGALTRGGA
jgi:hypothetical protein